ncbi:hypothetical protein, partial [Gordonibacter sp. RACS_AR49]|uniref:hypothetical protein n=1 Tax=Gordonibacter sp. RACS_AR49 TaxID=2871986 RepID=UPI002630A0A8
MTAEAPLGAIVGGLERVSSSNIPLSLLRRGKMREKASFKAGVVAVAVLIVAATFLVPNPEG